MSEIVSKERVREHGEVFTRDEEVIAMHNLIPDEDWAKKDFVYLEPTCGKGVFIKHAVRKKLEKGLTITQALNTTWGMDIMEDNIIDTKIELCLIANTYIETKIKEIIKKDNVTYYDARKHEQVKKLAIDCMCIIENNIILVKDSLEEINSGNFEKRKPYYKISNDDMMDNNEQKKIQKKKKKIIKKYIDNELTDDDYFNTILPTLYGKRIFKNNENKQIPFMNYE